MELDAIVQIVTVLAAALAIVWHQQHNTDKLRADFNTANHQLRGDLNKLREDFNAANHQLRADFNAANHQLRGDLNKLREDFNAANHQLRGDLNKLREGINGREPPTPRRHQRERTATSAH